MIVTSGGKNIAPAPLETSLVSSKYIEQIVVIGDKRNFLSALIVPSFDNIKSYLLTQGKELSSNEAMVDYPDVLELVEREVNNAMSSFSKFEQIKKFALISRQFMIEKGEMTPKMSIVRKVVEKNFQDKIDELYKGANE
jgi:long-chain acyl-CoA synthetase